MYDLLQGLRVLDLTTVVLGPFATRYLGDFGADVIKVEPPGGEVFRHIRPARSLGMGAGFLNFNRNKRSVCLDLKSAEDKARFDDLVRDADVLVHNMRTGAARRLDIGWEAMRALNPRLVYCVSTGYGSTGPNADEPAYDDIIQAASGLADLNRGPDGAPRFVPSILCDKISGLHMVLAVLSGVVRQRRTGQGCHIEAPMFEGMVSFLLSEHLHGETFRPAEGSMGYDRITSPMRKPFATQDGYISALPYTTRNWVAFLNLVDRGDLAAADWVRDPEARSQRITELYAVIEAAMPTRTTAEWLVALRDIDVPATVVNMLGDLLTDPHLAEVGMFQDITHPTEGALRSVRAPFWIDDAEPLPDAPAPAVPVAGGQVDWYPRDAAASSDEGPA